MLCQKSDSDVILIESTRILAPVLRAKMDIGPPRWCGQKWQRPIFEPQFRPIGVRTSAIGVRAGKIGIRGMQHQMQTFRLGYGTWLWLASPLWGTVRARGGALEAFQNPSKMAFPGHFGAPAASGALWGGGATGVRNV